MKKVLIITYSQSGQLDEIVTHVINKLNNDTSITIYHEKLVPEPDFPFPWSDMSFWDAMPECVRHIPSEIEPLSIKADKKFDLILMDMQMPEMNGLEATQKIKLIRPKLPVIATTANTFDEDEVTCRKAGCDAFLTKPLHFRKLFELMQSFFDSQE